MAPLLPLFIILLIPFALLTAVLIYLGVNGNKALIIVGLSFCVLFCILLLNLFFHEDIIRNQYSGTYIANDTSKDHPKIKLVLTKNNYTITPNSFTNCTHGTWELKNMDTGDIIDFNCINNHQSFQLFLDKKELISGKLKFTKQTEE